MANPPTDSVFNLETQISFFPRWREKKRTFKVLWAKLFFPLTPVARRVILLNAGEEISSRALRMHTESKCLFGVG